MADIKYTDLSGLEYFSDTIKSILDDKVNTSSLGSYYTKSQVDNLVGEKSNAGHTHDDRYYTESEINSSYIKCLKQHTVTTCYGKWTRVANITGNNLTAGSSLFIINITSHYNSTVNHVTFLCSSQYSSRLSITEISPKHYASVKVRISSSDLYGKNTVVDITPLSSGSKTNEIHKIDIIPIGDNGIITGMNEWAPDTVDGSCEATSHKTGAISSAGFFKTDGTEVSYSGHTHTKSNITDFPASLPASDVHNWAKAAAKPSYKTSEVAEETNLYFTNQRAINACSGTYMPAGDTSHGTHVTSGNQTWSGNKTFTGYINISGTDLNLNTSGSTSNDSADIVFTYGNGNEKCRIYTTNEPNNGNGPYYRVKKTDGTSLYDGRLATVADIPGAATQSAAGLMSAADKKKLDGIASGANNYTYTHPATHPASIITGLATVAKSGSYNDLSNKPTIPTALPANGGNADTVDNKHASDFMAAGDTSHGTHVTTGDQTWSGTKTFSSEVIFDGGGTKTDICSGIAAAFKTKRIMSNEIFADSLILGSSSGSSSNKDFTIKKYGKITSTEPDSLTTLLTIDTKGRIKKTSGGSWISARDNAIVMQEQTNNSGVSYNPIIGAKTQAGFWSIGSCGGETLYLSYDTDENYDVGNNTSKTILFPAAGSTGTIALTSDIPTSLPANGGNADTVDNVHLEWSGSQAASSTDWLAGWNSDGTKIKAVKRSDLSVNYATTAGSAVDQTARNAASTAQTTANGKWTYNADTIKAVKVNNAGNADTVGGKSASDFATSGHSHSNYINCLNNHSVSTTYGKWTRVAQIEGNSHTGGSCLFIINITSHYASTVNHTAFLCSSQYSGRLSIKEISPKHYSSVKVRISSSNSYGSITSVDITPLSTGSKTQQSHIISIIPIGDNGAITAKNEYVADTISGSIEATSHPAGAITSANFYKDDGTSVSYDGHTHTKSQITDFPSSLLANGGNADTVGGKSASDFATSGHTHTSFGTLTLTNGSDLNLQAASGSSDSGDIVFKNGSGTEIMRIWCNEPNGAIRFGPSDGIKTLLHSGNSSVSKSGETLTVKINGTSCSLTNTNTWRSITNSYSGTATDTSLSQKGGNDLYNSIPGMAFGTSVRYIGTSEDLNTYTVDKSGTYSSHDNKTYTNGPGYQNFGLIVGRLNTVYTYQLALPYSTNSLKYRSTCYSGSGNVWLGWRTIIDSDNIGSYASPLNHTHTSFANDITVTGKVKASSGFFQDSDERLKDIISNIDVDVDKLSELRKVYFNFKDDTITKHIGVIAQDVQAIYPELVSENDEGTLSVAYDKLSVIALDAVDQLNQKNKKLEDRLNKLEELLKSKGII